MKNLLFTVALLIPLIAFGQSTEMKVMDDGVVVPQIDHTTITSPTDGQMVYDHLTATFWYYDGTGWIEIGDDKDKDSTNELQEMTVSVEGDTVYLTGGNYIIVQGSSDANYIKDYDGNVYTEVVIGNQIWLKENMIATHYRDGTPIPKVELEADWIDYINTPFDGYCWYDNDSTTYQKFGALYNFGVIDSTINGNKNICPEGFDIPIEDDFIELSQAANLGGSNNAGRTLKLPIGEFWLHTPNYPFGAPGNNLTGFSAKGTGLRWSSGFDEHKRRIQISSRTPSSNNANQVMSLIIRYSENSVNISDNPEREGSAIRCIKIED